MTDLDAVDRATGDHLPTHVPRHASTTPPWTPPPVVYHDPCWRVLFTAEEAKRVLTLMAAAHVAGVEQEGIDRLIAGKLREVGT